MECVDRLSENRAHPSLQTHLIDRRRRIWEAYVDDANRVTYQIEGGTIRLRTHCTHDILKAR